MENKKTSTKSIALFVGAIALALFSLLSVAKGAEERTLRQVIIDETSDKLVASLLGELYPTEEVTVDEEFAGATANRPVEYIYDFVNGVNAKRLRLTDGAGQVVHAVDVEAWPSNTYYLAWQNPYDGQSLLDITTAFDGTVSSTFKYYCGTTSTATVAYNTSLPPASLIDGFQFVTTTFDIGNAPTSTVSSLDGADNGTLGHARVSVPDNWYGFCMVQAHNATGCVNNSACEQVTSTNRGWSAISYGNWTWKE